MLKSKLLAPLLALVLASIALAAPAANATIWQDNSVHYWYGSAFAEPAIPFSVYGSSPVPESTNISKNVISFTHASGSGYEPNGAGSTTNVGALADLRGGLRLGQVRIWIGARMVGLLRAETVKVQSTSPGVADRFVLSKWDAQLGAGGGYRFQ